MKKVPVIGYTKDGDFCHYFDSMTEAASYIGLKNPGDIRTAIDGIDYSKNFRDTAGKWNGKRVWWVQV